VLPLSSASLFVLQWKPVAEFGKQLSVRCVVLTAATTMQLPMVLMCCDNTNIHDGAISAFINQKSRLQFPTIWHRNFAAKSICADTWPITTAHLNLRT
jgi:hypothetical protein